MQHPCISQAMKDIQVAYEIREQIGCSRGTYQAANEGFVFIRFYWQGGSAHWFIIWHPYYYSQCFVIQLQTWLEFVRSQSGQCLWVGGPLVLFKLSSALASPYDLKSTDCGHVKCEDSFIQVWIRVWLLQAVGFMISKIPSTSVAKHLQNCNSSVACTAVTEACA